MDIRIYFLAKDNSHNISRSYSKSETWYEWVRNLISRVSLRNKVMLCGFIIHYMRFLKNVGNKRILR